MQRYYILPLEVVDEHRYLEWRYDSLGIALTDDEKSLLRSFWAASAQNTVLAANNDYILLEIVDQHRGPKYFKWRYDPDPPGIDCRWNLTDYGKALTALVVADVTPEQHNSLVAHSDVLALPADVDSKVGGVALQDVRATLESFDLPAHWITAHSTYREVIKGIAGTMQFAHRRHALHDKKVIEPGHSLDMRLVDLPDHGHDELLSVADSMDIDRSNITDATTVRQLLKHMADHWQDKPIYIGGTEL